MTGPQHYSISEKLLELLNTKMERGEPITTADLQAYLALAQVHATLALAAASAQNIRRNGAVESEPDDWSEVLS